MLNRETLLQEIEQRLRTALSPRELIICDESADHAGHPGAATGMAHIGIEVISDQFKDLNSLQRHRLIYAALGELMQTDIHALRIIKANA